MRRVFVEAVVAALFVGIGSFLLYDSVEDWAPATDDAEVMPSLKQSLSWALRKFNIMVNDAPMPCGDSNTTTLSFNGSCGFLDGKQGCCSAPPMIPTVPVGSDSTCSSACVPPWTGYWCQLSCVAFNVNKTSICRSAAQSLFQNCNSCQSLSSYFKGATTVDEWATAFGYKLVSYTPCVDFTQGTPAVETSAPTVSLTVPTSTVTITSNTQITLSATATSSQAPSSSTFRLLLGSSNLLTVRANAGKWSKSMTAGQWLFSMTIQLSNLAPSGTYTFSARVRNGAGETTQTATFTVNTVVTATSLAAWDLCSAGTGVDGSVLPPSVQNIDSLNCCGATCDLSAAVGSSVTMTTFTLRGIATLRSFTLRLSGSFVLESTATALTLLTSMFMRFQANARMVVTQNLLVTTDGSSRMWFRARSVFRISGNRRMLNCAGRSFSETNVEVQTGARFQVSGANGQFETNSSMDVAGDVEANVTTRTRVAMVFRSRTVIRGSGRFRFGRGIVRMFRIRIVIRIVVRQFIRITRAVNKVDLTQMGAQVPMCGTTAEGAMEIDDGTAIVANLDSSCTISDGSNVSSSSVNTTVLSGGGLLLTNVSTTSGTYKSTVLDLRSGSLSEIQFVSGFEATLPSTEKTIAVIMWGSGGQSECSTAMFSSTTVSMAGGASFTRQYMLMCTTAANYHTLHVKFPVSAPGAAPTSAPTASEDLSALSAQNYTIVSTKSCSELPQTQFIQLIAENQNIPTTAIVMNQYICGSITAIFQCRAASVSAADARCASVKRAAETPGNALNTALGVSGTRGVPTAAAPVADDDESNEGLYALFSLLLIPICCIIAYMLLKKKKEPLTFSSVPVPQKDNAAYDPYVPYDTAAAQQTGFGYSEGYSQSGYTGTTYDTSYANYSQGYTQY